MRRRTTAELLGVLFCLSSLAFPQSTDWQRNNDAGARAFQQGQYGEAEKLFAAALKEAEKFADNDPRLATSLKSLVFVFVVQGKPIEAEPLLRRLLTIRLKVLPADHPDIADTFNLISLVTREQRLGPDHPDVAMSLNNLAGLYLDQGKYGEAEPLYRRSLAIREKALGPEHPQVATSLNNLAALYQAQGKYVEAEPLFRRALTIWEKALGPEHPDVATSLEKYAKLLRQLKRDAEAAKMEERAKTIRAKQGPDKPKN